MTPTPEQLEEVARAMYDRMLLRTQYVGVVHMPPFRWETQPGAIKEDWRQCARAAWDAVVKAMDKAVRK